MHKDQYIETKNKYKHLTGGYWTCMKCQTRPHYGKNEHKCYNCTEVPISEKAQAELEYIRRNPPLHKPMTVLTQEKKPPTVHTQEKKPLTVHTQEKKPLPVHTQEKKEIACNVRDIVLAFGQGILEGIPFYINKSNREQSLVDNILQLYPNENMAKIRRYANNSIMISSSGSGNDYMEYWLINGIYTANVIGNLCEKYNCYVTNYSSEPISDDFKNDKSFKVWDTLLEVNPNIRIRMMFFFTQGKEKKEIVKIGKYDVNIEIFNTLIDGDIKKTIRNKLSEYHRLEDCKQNIFILDNVEATIEVAKKEGYNNSYLVDENYSLDSRMTQITSYIEKNKYILKK